MGADGYLFITNPEDVKECLLEVITDAIFDTIPDSECPEHGTYTIDLSKDNLLLDF